MEKMGNKYDMELKKMTASLSCFIDSVSEVVRHLDK